MALAGFKSIMKKTLVPLLIIFLAISVFVVLKKTKPVQPPVNVQQKIWPVQALSLKKQDLTPMISLYGKVESSQLVTAAAPVAGVVDSVWVKEGQVFKKGDLLVALNKADIELPFQVAKADVADTRAQVKIQGFLYEANLKRLEKEKRVLDIKRNDVSRNEKLVKKDLASQSTVDKSKEALVRQEYVVVGAELAVQENKAKVAQLKARLQKAEANLAQAKINLARGVVVAPYSGRVSSVSVSKGDRVGVNSALLSFYSLDSLELRAKIPTLQLPKVYRALQAEETLEATLRLEDQTYHLPLERLAGQAETSGLDAFFKMPQALSIVRPGDLYQINLHAPPVRDVFAVPYSALYGADRIYLIEQGQLKGTSVKPMGETNLKGQVWAIIQAAIPENSLVSITHLPNAISGLSVSVVE